MSELTYARLKELLCYDYRTGDFKWYVGRVGASKGKVAGYKNDHGYVVIMIDGNPYLSHRLVWLYEYGYFPEYEIDHINRVRDDNRISNLREVSKQCNLRNAKTPTTNKSGVKGVHWQKKTAGGARK